MSWQLLVLWATFFLSGTNVLDGIGAKKNGLSPIYYFALNHLLLAVVFVPPLLFTNHWAINEIGLLIPYAFIYFGMWVSWFQSLRFLSLNRAVNIFNLGTVLTYIGGGQLFGETLNIYKTLGLLLILATVFIETQHLHQHRREKNTVQGYLYVILATLFSVASNLYLKVVVPDVGGLRSLQLLHLLLLPALVLIIGAQWKKKNVLQLVKNHAGFLVTRNFFLGVGLLAFFSSLMQGPVSLISAILASRPIVTLLLSVGAKRVFRLSELQQNIDRKLLISTLGAGLGLLLLLQ